MGSVFVVMCFVVAMAAVIRIGLRDTELTTSQYMMQKTKQDRK